MRCLAASVAVLVSLSCQTMKDRKENHQIGSEDLESESSKFWNGVDSNYYPTLSRAPFNFTYHHNGEKIEDFFKFLPEVGINSVRLRLYAKDQSVHNLAYALQQGKIATKNGLDINLVIFLSDDLAAGGNQPVASRWAHLYPDVDKVADEVKAYCSSVAKSFNEMNIPVAVYAIGNEINQGISGFNPPSGSDREDSSSYGDMAKIIRSGQKGILSEDNDAKFLHHLSRMKYEFLENHFTFMIENGVKIDYLGLSLYPSGGHLQGDNLDPFKELAKKLYQKFNRPVVIPEYGYPAFEITDLDQWKTQIRTLLATEAKFPVVKDEDVDFIYRISTLFNESFLGNYPGTPDGQAQLIEDLLTWSKESPSMKGAFYWSPEGSHPTAFWYHLSLFDSGRNSRPGLGALKAGAVD